MQSQHDNKSTGSSLGTEALVVVLVEDNRLNRELAQTVLELRGHRVVPITNGAAFRAYLSEGERPDVVILDIMLPDANGVDLLKEMRALSHMDGIGAVAVTAHALVGEAERLRREGFDKVLTKPIDTRRFALEITEVASKRLATSESKLEPNEP